LTLDPDPRRDALRLLASREHSRHELGVKLRARGYDAGEVEAVLDDLGRRGLLSDARMAEAYVAERVRKGFGPVRVRHELRRRGVPEPLIDAHLERGVDKWLERLMVVHDKKFGAGRATDAKERARRGRFLEQRGFPLDLIARFLRGDDEF